MQQAAAGTAQAAGAASKLTRVRHRKAVLASGALTNTVQAALKALQVSPHGKGPAVVPIIHGTLACFAVTKKGALHMTVTVMT
jgi:hypothetical protein